MDVCVCIFCNKLSIAVQFDDKEEVGMGKERERGRAGWLS